MIRKYEFKSNSNLILRRDEGNMQVWPPKELPIIKMTDDMLIRGVSIREFEAILKTGFTKMYAETRSSITPPIETRAISKSHDIAGRGRCLERITSTHRLCGVSFARGQTVAVKLL